MPIRARCWIDVALFLARHGIVGVLVMVALCLLWTLVYVALLVVAVVTNSGLGSPVLWPIGIVLLIGCCAMICWGVFAPACAVGELARRALRRPRLLAIPFVVCTAALVWVLVAHLAERMVAPGMSASTTGRMKFFLFYLTLPLGVYWWATEGPGALFELAMRQLRRFRK